MATKVYEIQEVELQNGDVATLKPLNIFHLRQFQARLTKMTDAEKPTEMETMDALVDLAGICLQTTLPALAEDRQALEQALDMDTIYKIVEVCGGIKFNDPNLLAAAAALAITE